MGKPAKRKRNRKHGTKTGSPKKRIRAEPKATMDETQETIVYFWSPKQGTGHVSLKLPKGVYISFRSLSKEYKVKVDQPSHPERLDEDIQIQDGRQPDTILKIPSALLEEDSILSWWQSFKEEKTVFLLKDQSCQVIYNALRAGGGPVCEPLHWDLKGLEIYVRKMCRRPKQNMFGDIFSIEWFQEMDFISKLLFMLMIILLVVMVAMALLRISPEGSDIGHTCFNDYIPCKQYVEEFIKPPDTTVMPLIKEEYGSIIQFTMGVIVIFICSRFTMENLFRMANLPTGTREDEDAYEEDDDDVEEFEQENEEIESNDSNDDGGEEGDDLLLVHLTEGQRGFRHGLVVRP